MFGDLEDTDTSSDDEISDEEEEVLDNLSFSQWEDSMEESVEEAQVDLPFSALNALMNSSFDAVLDS